MPMKTCCHCSALFLMMSQAHRFNQKNHCRFRHQILITLNSPAVSRLAGFTLAKLQLANSGHCQSRRLYQKRPRRALHRNKGLGKEEVKEAAAGDIIHITGLDGIDISDTVCAVDTACVNAIPPMNQPSA